MNIIIVGAGGHGQVVADIIRSARSCTPYTLLGFVDDGRVGRAVLDAAVFGPIAMLPELPHDLLVVAIGDNDARAELHDSLEAVGERFATLVHLRAIVAEDVTIGDGTMVTAGAIVNTGTHIGRGVILNTGCTVDHHTVIGDFAHIAPGVHMGGGVTVGERALVGIGATVLPRIRIGAGATVGAGAVVTRDVPDGCTVVGVPAAPVDAPLPVKKAS